MDNIKYVASQIRSCKPPYYGAVPDCNIKTAISNIKDNITYNSEAEKILACHNIVHISFVYNAFSSKDLIEILKFLYDQFGQDVTKLCFDYVCENITIKSMIFESLEEYHEFNKYIEISLRYINVNSCHDDVIKYLVSLEKSILIDVLRNFLSFGASSGIENFIFDNYLTELVDLTIIEQGISNKFLSRNSLVGIDIIHRFIEEIPAEKLGNLVVNMLRSACCNRRQVFKKDAIFALNRIKDLTDKDTHRKILNVAIEECGVASKEFVFLTKIFPEFKKFIIFG